ENRALPLSVPERLAAAAGGRIADSGTPKTLVSALSSLSASCPAQQRLALRVTSPPASRAASPRTRTPVISQPKLNRASLRNGTPPRVIEGVSMAMSPVVVRGPSPAAIGPSGQSFPAEIIKAVGLPAASTRL